MRIGSQLRSHVRRAGTAAAVAFALAGLPTAATAAGAGGSSGVPANLRQHNTDGWWYPAMHLPQVQKHLNGAGVTVAVIDGPIDTAASDLRGADITLGRNCVGGMTRSQVPTQENPDAPGGAHGTSMAAYIVGQGHGNGPGGAGILGVAPRAHLLFYDAENAHADRAGNICGNTGPLIRAAVKAGADIISMSFAGTTDNIGQRKAVLWAERRGVVVVAGAGDTNLAGASSTVGFPAGDPGVVAVNAIDKAAKPWPFNPEPTTLPGRNGVPAVDAFPVISAPGVHLGALLWSNTRGFVSTAWGSGTSPATAIVSGALALVKQKYPKATGNQLIQDLIHNPGGTGYGWDRHYGFGIVSVPHMLAQDPTKWPDVNPLLNGPDAAIKNFPPSVYGHPAAAKTAKQSHPAKKAADTTSTNNTPGMPGNSGGGMPAWVWVVIAAVVVAIGGAAAKLGLSKRSTT